MPDPVVILHLSDLHFGPNNRFADSEETLKEWGGRLGQSVTKIAKDKTIPIDERMICVITGDITQTAHGDEFALAQSFMGGLVKELPIARSRFVFVPGNHDVSWHMCTAVDALHKAGKIPKTKLPKRMMADKFEDYRAFLEAFYGEPGGPTVGHETEQMDRVYEFDDINLSVAALNSCVLETHEHHLGSLEEHQAQRIMDHWKDDARTPRLKIVALHHNPVPTTECNIEEATEKLAKAWKDGHKDEKDWRDWVKRFAADAFGIQEQKFLKAIAADRHVQAVLHGHHHDSSAATWPWRSNNPGQTHVLSAGSLSLKSSKLPADQPNHAQLLVLDSDHGVDAALGELRVHGMVLDKEQRLKHTLSKGMYARHEATSKKERLHLPPKWKKQTKKIPKPPGLDLPIETDGGMLQGIMTSIVSDEPLPILALRPEELDKHLCEKGALTVIGNTYVPPDEECFGGSGIAKSRIYVGPADCGKTRAAAEWIREVTQSRPEKWVILRTDRGKIPMDAGLFDLKPGAYGSAASLPARAILFIDDLPDSLPPGEGDAAAEAVKRLFAWFAGYSSFQERRVVGTVRKESLYNRPDWPEVLPTLGEPLSLISLKPHNKKARRSVWKGMAKGRTLQGKQAVEYSLAIDKAFVESVSAHKTNIEGIAFYVAQVNREGRTEIAEADAESFRPAAVDTWKEETWPAIRDNFGIAASVFYTLARFLEAGLQPGSGFRGNLPPDWAYHEILGPALCEAEGHTGDAYVRVLEALLESGHAEGEKGKSIRPVYDFILQVPSLEQVECSLPSGDWFADHTTGLSAPQREALAIHLSAADLELDTQKGDAYWLLGRALGKDTILEATKKPRKTAKALAATTAAYDAVVSRFGNETDPELLVPVAMALNNKGVVLKQSGDSAAAIATYEDLDARFADASTPKLLVLVASALFNRGATLHTQGDLPAAIATYSELDARFGDETDPALLVPVAKALNNKGLALHTKGELPAAIAAFDDLIARFAETTGTVMLEAVAKALFSRAMVLSLEDKVPAAITALDYLISHFADATDARVLQYVAKGMFSKGLALKESGDLPAAITAFDDLVSRFADVTDTSLLQQVADALTNIGTALIETWHESEDKSALSEALKSARQAAEMGAGRYNLACVLALMGETDEAFDELEGCLDRDEIWWSHVNGAPDSDTAADRDWDGLREHPRYLALNKKYGQEKHPPEESV